ncbi:hypothetical protein PMAYCL1PPCAC_13925, partial [Pristionchus mayeri]
QNSSMEDSNEGEEPSSKKCKSESVETKDKKEHDSKQKNDLHCPMCNAGCLLRCECGHETHSSRHSIECDISNITVIRNEDEPIRRLTDQHVVSVRLPTTNTQCVISQCEKYPKTPLGYLTHLSRHHKTTLYEEGLFFECSRGCIISTRSDISNHEKTCDGRNYTLHRMDENGVEERVL